MSTTLNDPVHDITVEGRTVRCEYARTMECWCVWIVDGKTIGTYATRWDAVTARNQTVQAMREGTA